MMDTSEKEWSTFSTMLNMHHYGKSYRFEIDDYYELYPHLDNDYEFRGNCPITGKKDGLIVIEYPLTIELPYIEKSFTGEGYHQVVKPFFKYIDGKTKRQTWPPIKRLKNSVKSGLAQQINDKCKELSAKAVEQSYSFLLQNKNLSKKHNTCAHFETRLDFFIQDTHRLFHPKSDNILSWSDFTLTFNELFNNKHNHIWIDNSEDWNDTQYYRDFKHCYLFHDLFAHRKVDLQDLLQVDRVCVSFNLQFDKNYHFMVNPFADD